MRKPMMRFSRPAEKFSSAGRFFGRGERGEPAKIRPEGKK